MTHKIVLHTEANPEDNAMLQALYSRSADSVLTHLERLKKVGSGKFMQQYYVGYGHNSIADCGFITFYLEGISMLAAKAIEDNPLYNGQESSSRYIDWSTQPFYNPYTGEFKEEAEALLTKMREFYVSQIEPVKQHLRSQFPNEGADESTYEKAITAKSFDILRGFLPSGACTNVAATFSLRKAREHLELLSIHPLAEVRGIAIDAYESLKESFPNSFPDLKVRTIDEMRYDNDLYNFYVNPPKHFNANYFLASRGTLEAEVEVVDSTLFDKEMGKSCTNSTRAKKTALHKHSLYNRLTRYNIKGMIDFGSFRDLQRHRGGYCGMPLIDNVNGYHPWYINQLPTGSMAALSELINSISKFLEKTIPSDKVTYTVEQATKARAASFSAKLKNQYLLPMMTLVDVVLSYDLNQLTYVAELRGSPTVHPTLRAFVQDVATQVLDDSPGLNLFVNMDRDEFSIKRGKQDITKVEVVETKPIQVETKKPEEDVGD